jgi:hypothetical protein
MTDAALGLYLFFRIYMKSRIIPLDAIPLADEFERIRFWKENMMNLQLEEKRGRNFASRLYHKVF